MSNNLPLSSQLDKLADLPQSKLNAIFKQHGYRWEKFTQDDLDDNDDFDRSPGWYLFSSDGREVSEHDAIEEIVLGADLAKRIRSLENYRLDEIKRINKLFLSWYRAVIDYIKEYGQNIGEASFDASEELYDSRRHGIGYVLRTDGQTLYCTDYHGSDMVGPITYRLNDADADELEEYGGSNSQIIEALRGMATGVAMPTLIQKGLKISRPVELPPIADQPALPPDTPEYMLFFTDQVSALPFFFPNPEPCKSPRLECWLSLDKWHKFAFDNRYIYLRTGAPYDHDDDRYPLAKRYWESLWPYIWIRSPLTTEIKEWIDSHVPAWYSAEIHQQLLGYTGMHANSDKSKTEYPSEGALGRFKPQQHMGIAHCVRDALRMSGLYTIPLNSIAHIDAQLIYSNGESSLIGQPFSIWTDGPQSTEVFGGKFGEQLGKDAAFLVSTAARQREWRDNDAWRSLLTVSIAGRNEIRKDEKGVRSSGMGKTLTSLTLSDSRVIWLVDSYWWAMGEDGDAGDDHYLYSTQSAAEEKYRSIELH